MPKGSPVVCAKWQPEGKSASNAVYLALKAGGWRSCGEILAREPESWPASLPVGVSHIILADDFVGTGDTMAALGDASMDCLALMLQRFPEAQIHVLVAVGFEASLSYVKSSWPQDERISLVCEDILTDRDTCFSDNSSVLGDDSQRQELRAFCLTAPPEGLGKLGYGGIGALVVLSHTIPDNTLPIVWDEPPNWTALFPLER